jgi:hypothetical protein
METIQQYIENYNVEIIGIIFSLILILLIVVIIQNIKLNKIKSKLVDFTNGSKNINIEEVLLGNKKDISNIKKTQYDILKNLDIVNSNLRRTFEKISVYKYDAFEDIKGKLSSVLTMLNKENSGFIINTIYSREGCYIYIKEVINGETEQILSKEEKTALEKSLSK